MSDQSHGQEREALRRKLEKQGKILPVKKQAPSKLEKSEQKRASRRRPT